MKSLNITLVLTLIFKQEKIQDDKDRSWTVGYILLRHKILQFPFQLNWNCIYAKFNYYISSTEACGRSLIRGFHEYTVTHCTQLIIKVLRFSVSFRTCKFFTVPKFIYFNMEVELDKQKEVLPSWNHKWDQLLIIMLHFILTRSQFKNLSIQKRNFSLTVFYFFFPQK